MRLRERQIQREREIKTVILRERDREREREIERKGERKRERGRER